MTHLSPPDRQRTCTWVIYLLTGLAVFMLKAHYRRATVDDLGWILEPTARAVGWLQGQRLLRDPTLGWRPADASFVIAPACAGANFLIVALCVTVCGFVHRFRSILQRCGWLVMMAGSAYLLTIAVNALRIVVAVELYQADISAGWLTAERVHRIAGTLIYLAGLCAAWVGGDAISIRLGRAPAAAGWAPMWVLPAAYLGLTVVVPLLNGAWRQFGSQYLEHAITVTLIAVSTVRFLSRIRRASSNVFLFRQSGVTQGAPALRNDGDGEANRTGG